MHIQYIKGVGEKRAQLFTKLGIDTAEALLQHYPRAYEDRTALKSTAMLLPGETCCVRATVAAPVSHHRIRAGLEVCKTQAFDEDGLLTLTFFNAPYIKNTLGQGMEFIFYGKISGEPGHLEMVNPVCESADKAGQATGRILPLYRLTAGLSQGFLRSVVRNALEKVGETLSDPLPESLRQRLQLCRWRFAVENIHYPQNYEALTLARRRLVFDELFTLQLALSRLKSGRGRAAGYALPAADLSDFYAALPFTLTNDQRAAVDDACRDMASGRLCHRLIQGDVGSGKTLVAAACAVSAIRGGGVQAALMAPTEILAEQHYRTLEPLLTPLGIRCVLLTGGVSPAQKKAVRASLADGSAQLAIGTHALISKGVSFHRLGLTITDEQHRFGVRQQSEFTAADEGRYPPHRLVMSATPIPRTLALILYGDMDITVMKGMPPGRQPVKTYVVTEEMRARIDAFIRKLTGLGQQVFIVCPLIVDELGLELAAAEDYADTLRERLPELRIGLLHGRMKAKDKESVMRAFAEGALDVLVATTVIEVGVNVPNATLMIVENAERFGLSQLHQLRGRVGRGELESHCVFFLQTKGETARKRLEIMRSGGDGFAIAEADLHLRGPGDFFGERQHGLPEFKLADLSSDLTLVELARVEAEALLAADPELAQTEHAALKTAADALLARLDGE